MKNCNDIWMQRVGRWADKRQIIIFVNEYIDE